MHLTLRSRVERVGNRDVQIMEVTRVEYESLRWLRWIAVAMTVGFLATAHSYIELLKTCTK